MTILIQIYQAESKCGKIDLEASPNNKFEI